MKQELIDEITKTNPDYWADRFFDMYRLQDRDNPIRMFRHGLKWTRLRERQKQAQKRSSFKRYVAKYPRPSKAHELPDLPQELSEELQLIARGFSRNEIAKLLGTSSSTISQRVRVQLDYYRETLPRPGRHTP